MPYSLFRESDGAGDSGQMSCALYPIYDEKDSDIIVDVKYVHNSPPVVGASLRVGSPYGRTMQAQDYWTTTMVAEILDQWVEEPEDKNRRKECVRFKTINGSTYVWKSF
jgi:hypothetical protein